MSKVLRDGSSVFMKQINLDLDNEDQGRCYRRINDTGPPTCVNSGPRTVQSYLKKGPRSNSIQGPLVTSYSSSDDVQELLDCHNQELTIDEFIEMQDNEGVFRPHSVSRSNDSWEFDRMP
ncbi:hypothetical protein TNCV_1975161 [Trichonephila clavipes]|nr:hypothetical protein TNCV_1975161 [Trichonephila clavipes]